MLAVAEVLVAMVGKRDEYQQQVQLGRLVIG
jgi:hypothetical protein